MPDPKRPRVNLNQELKVQVLKYIVGSSIKLLAYMNLMENFTNLTVGHHIMSTVQGAHNIMRKMANSRMNTHANLDLNATITTNGADSSVTYRVIIVTIMRPEAALCI